MGDRPLPDTVATPNARHHEYSNASRESGDQRVLLGRQSYAIKRVCPCLAAI